MTKLILNNKTNINAHKGDRSIKINFNESYIYINDVNG